MPYIHIDTGYSFISPYSVMILLSFIAGLIGQYLLNVKRGVGKNYARYLFALGPLLSIAGGLLMTYITSKGESFGLSSIGGLVGMYAAAVIMGLISRDRYGAKAMLDNCTLVLPLMYSVSKMGCFLGGCCFGVAYHGPFCVEYTGNGITDRCVFPVQLAETIVFLVIFIIGISLERKRRRNTVFVVFMASAAAKFMLDFLRDSHTGCVISLNQIICLVMMLAMSSVIAGKKMKKQPL